MTEEVYERLVSYKRDGESPAEALDRLLGSADSDWRTHFGFLDGDESREFAELVKDES